MSEFHLAYLSLGSNIDPEINLPRAVRLLSQQGEILGISSVWESKPVGGSGGNYLNACLSFKTRQTQEQLKSTTILDIETNLGRRRTDDRYAARTIDIDIILYDNEIVSGHWLVQAFVVVPLAELLPDFQNTLTMEPLSDTATRLRQGFWLKTHQGIFANRTGSSVG